MNQDSSKNLIILTHVLNNTAVAGFLPAAKALGLKVWLLTDDPAAHHGYFSNPLLSAYPDQILSCDVFNAQSIIELLLQQELRADAIFTNSDHLQTACAQVAEYFKLPGKDWRVCYRSKNKRAMRRHLQQEKIASAWYCALHNIKQLAQLTLPYPVVIKPQQGVASMDVKRCENHQQLREFCQQFWRQLPGQALLAEQYLQGPVFTLETLGDGETLIPLGGFDVEMSPPPYFIERHASWNNNIASKHRQAALAQLQAFGVNFGACHSEFVLTEDGPRLIEINYRSIGGGKEFLLNNLLDGDYFSQILSLHLGEPLQLKQAVVGHACASYYTAKHAGTLMSCPKPFECHEPIRVKLELLKQPGEQITLTHSDRDRLAVFSAYAKADQNIDEHDFINLLSAHIPQQDWEIC